MNASPRPSFLRRSLVVVVSMVLGGLLASLATILKPGDGDRPPIIVTNGSVHVELLPGGNPRGKFVKGSTAASKTIWHHENDAHGGDAPKKMDVTVFGVDSSLAGNCAASRHFYAQRVRAIKAVYSVPDEADRELNLTVERELVEIAVAAAANATQPAGREFEVHFDADEAKLRSVTLMGPGSKETTCTFATEMFPMILVEQRH